MNEAEREREFEEFKEKKEAEKGTDDGHAEFTLQHKG